VTRTGSTDADGAEKFRVEAELRWPTLLAILVALALYALLPSLLPDWIRYGVIVVCVALLIPVFVLNPKRLVNEARWARRLAVIVATVLLIANLIAFVELMFALLNADAPDPRGLLLAALEVWVTQAIAFAVIYWELDRGGPVTRRMQAREKHPPADFRFPQDEDVSSPPTSRVGANGAPPTSTTCTSRPPTPWRSAPPTCCR
jgi:uncharacterized membrane protein